MLVCTCAHCKCAATPTEYVRIKFLSVRGIACLMGISAITDTVMYERANTDTFIGQQTRTNASLCALIKA
jgi:hypothetical protein